MFGILSLEYDWDQSGWWSLFYLPLMISLLSATFLPTLRSKPSERHSKGSSNETIPARRGWVLMELPALVAAVYGISMASPATISRLPNTILVGGYTIHYINRSFIYPLRIRGGKSLTKSNVIAALIINSCNGYSQTRSLSSFIEFPDGYEYSIQFVIGTMLFIGGALINLHADSVLRSLRKHGEVGYRIPVGGLFEYVSCANYFGEIVQWFGFTMAANWEFPQLSFFMFSFMVLARKAIGHHRFYIDTFRDYPRERKALIPFLL